jgi:hypothetical protein
MNFNQLFQKMRELDAPVSEELVGGQKNLDVDHDGDIEANDLKDLRAKKEVDECGPMGMPGMPDMSRPTPQQDSVNMNVSMNGSGANGIRDLMDLLRNLEQGGMDHDHSGEPIEIEMEPMFGDEMDEEQLANSPNEKYAPMSRMTATGDDLHSAGDEEPKVNGGGNPMETLVAKLQELYDTMELDEMGGGKPAAPAPADPAKIQAEIDRFSKGNDMNIPANKQYVAGLQAKLGTTATKPAAAPVAPGAGAGRGGQGGPTAAQNPYANSTGTKPAAGAPKVAYEKDFPEATAKELQTKLNAAGEKLTVDGKMGPATRAAMARHPEITTNPNAPATPAAPTAPAPTAPAPTGSIATDTTDPLNQPKPAAPAAPTAPAPTGSIATDTTDPLNQPKPATVAPTATAGTPPPAATTAAAAAPVSGAPANVTAQGSEFGTDATFAKPAAAPAASQYSLAPKSGGPGLKMPTAESAELTSMLRIAGLR